jgi:glycyl-tRNA synthetase alpha subunit
MLAKRLPIPAYDMLLKCSHAFNVLDARGAVGVTERADCFATMRALAREVTGRMGQALVAVVLVAVAALLSAAA